MRLMLTRVLVCIATLLVQIAELQAQSGSIGAPDNDPVARRLEVVVKLAVALKGQDGAASVEESLRIFKAAIHMDTATIVRKYKERSLEGNGGYGPFSAGLSDEQVSSDFESMKQRFESAEDEYAQQRVFVRSSSQHWAPGTAEILIAAINAAETGAQQPPSDVLRQFVLEVVSVESPQAALLRLRWTPTQLTSICGVTLLGMSIDAGEPSPAPGTIAGNAYDFGVQRPSADAFLVSLRFQPLGYPQILSTSVTVPAKESLTAMCARLQSENAELRAQSARFARVAEEWDARVAIADAEHVFVESLIGHWSWMLHNVSRGYPMTPKQVEDSKAAVFGTFRRLVNSVLSFQRKVEGHETMSSELARFDRHPEDHDERTAGMRAVADYVRKVLLSR